MIDGLPPRYSPDGNSASGGHGSVFFCDDSHLERKVAVKVLKNDDERRRLSDEVQALLQMRSKHVVQIYDVVVGKKGQLGIVQEFVEGDDLIASVVPRSSAENYLKTLWQIAAGISDIHDAGIIHRDIKPNNIKLTGEGIIKIFDFGLAREEGPNARTVGFVGTRGFAAPEQLMGGAFTKAVDTYAFGATALFIALQNLPGELLTMPPKFPKANPFLALPTVIDPSLASTLYQCLASVPADRPEMREVRDQLACHLLFNRHQALAVYQGRPSYLNSINPFVSLEYATVGRIDIRYDGLAFRIDDVEGEVSINNRNVRLGDEIPGSCVIALGSSARRANERVFITFDVSYPEVVL
jgi:serine/threonine protein kinase